MSAGVAYLVPFSGALPEAVAVDSLKISDDSVRLTKLHDSLNDVKVYDAPILGFTDKGVVVVGDKYNQEIGNIVSGYGFAANANKVPEFANAFDRAAIGRVSLMGRASKPSIMGHQSLRQTANYDYAPRMVA